MGKREAVIRICNEWQEREHAQADEGAYRAMEAREHAQANNGRTPRHTRGHA